MLWVALPQIDRAPGCKQPRLSREGDAMSFGLYAIGLAIAVGGLICGAHLVLMPAHWIAVGAIVLLEVVILNGVKATRQKDPVGCDRMAVYTTNTVSRPLVPDALAVSFIGGKDRRECLLSYLWEPDLSDGTGKWDY